MSDRIRKAAWEVVNRDVTLTTTEGETFCAFCGGLATVLMEDPEGGSPLIGIGHDRTCSWMNLREALAAEG